MLDQSESTVLDIITVQDKADLPIPQGEVHVAYPPLTRDEDTFALAIIEFSGNVKAAYVATFGVDPFALARGHELLAKPAIALKIRSITDSIQDQSLISVGSHLNELAEIRDLAKATGQLKTALAAERNRGEAVGIYQKHDAMAKGKGNGNVNLQVNFVSKHDQNI